MVFGGIAALIPHRDRLIEVVVVEIAQSPWSHAGQKYLVCGAPSSPGRVVRMGNKPAPPKVESI